MPGLGELLIILVIVGMTGIWIWALVDVVRVPDDAMFRAGNKIIWVLVVAIGGILGALIYFVVGRPQGGTAPPSRPTP